MATDANGAATRKRTRERKYGQPERVRIPEEAQSRLDVLERLTYRSRVDLLRYLLIVGLEEEERRQRAAARREGLPEER